MKDGGAREGEAIQKERLTGGRRWKVTAEEVGLVVGCGPTFRALEVGIEKLMEPLLGLRVVFECLVAHRISPLIGPSLSPYLPGKGSN